MRVLISEAGIAGPTLPWFLARAGARITIVEKSHSLLPYGQNIDMQGSHREDGASRSGSIIQHHRERYTFH